MPRLIPVLCLSFVALACGETPSFAQRAGAVPKGLCEGLPNGSTGVCMEMAFEKKNKELKEIVSQIRDTLDPKKQKKIDEAEQLWERYRKLTCDLDGEVYFDGGTGEDPEVERCLYIETDLQIKDLHAIYDWLMRDR
jgi:hypothetical protein